MTYLNFTKIAPPAPNDPNVSRVNHLNNNWDHLESKLGPYVNGGSLSGIDRGQEYFDSNFRFAVFDGTATRVPDDIDAAWSAWTALPILSPRVIRPSFTPRWRNNSLLRMVELSGGVLFDSAASAWTMGSAFQLNVLGSGSPPSSMGPVGANDNRPCATSLSAGTGVASAGRVNISTSGSWVMLTGQYMGATGGGNFIMLDQVWWWY